MGLAEDRAMLQGGAEKLQEALGKLQGVIQDVEDATGMVAATVQGYDAQDLIEALGMIGMASERCTEAGQAIAGATSNLEGYIGRMS